MLTVRVDHHAQSLGLNFTDATYKIAKKRLLLMVYGLDIACRASVKRQVVDALLRLSTERMDN